MDTRRSVDASRPRGADGFTLVEVIVAISLLLVVLGAATPMIVGGLRLSATERSQQTAVIVANEALEQVRARSKNLNSVDALVSGRAATTDAQHRWEQWGDIPGVAETSPAWDAHATSGSTQVLPMTTQTTRNGTVFTVDTLIGTCSNTTVSGKAVCKNTTGEHNMVRAIVIVSWGDDQSYSTATLFNLDTDLEWNRDA